MRGPVDATDLCAQDQTTFDANQSSYGFFDATQGLLYLNGAPQPDLTTGKYEFTIALLDDSETCDIEVNVINPCDQATLTLANSLPFGNQQYTLGDPEQSVSWSTDWSDMVTSSFTDQGYGGICGDYGFNINIATDGQTFDAFANYKDTHFRNNAGA